MKTLLTLLSVTVLGLGFTASNAPAQTLGELLKAEGFDKMLGAWVDQDTNGENLRLAWRWKIKDHAIETVWKSSNGGGAGLTVLKPGSEDPMYVGGGDNGRVSVGKWSAKDGKLILEVESTSPEGQESTMYFTHELIDKKTLKMTMGSPDSDQTAEVMLVRQAKKKGGKTEGAEKAE